jgi:hypothetical protein
MKDIYVSRDKSPQMYFHMAKSLLQKNEQVKFVALEGAIVIAIDSANILQRENVASIVKMSTSSVEVSYDSNVHSVYNVAFIYKVKSRNLPRTNIRSKIEITLEATVQLHQFQKNIQC